MLNDASFPLFFRRHFDWPEEFTLSYSLRTQGFPVRESLVNVALSCSFQSSSVFRVCATGPNRTSQSMVLNTSSKKKLIK